MKSKNIFAAFAKMPDRVTGRGARETEIRAAERALAISIRGSYREYLTQFGWGGADAYELYGLGDDVPPYLNLIDITRSERVEMEPPLALYLLPIMNDGGGNLYCLDTSISNAEPSVVLWLHDEPVNQVPAIQESTFVVWFAGLLEVH